MHVGSVGRPRFIAEGREALLRSVAPVLLLAMAGLAYAYHLGRAPLAASEAYSALVAVQPTITLVAHSALTGC